MITYLIHMPLRLSFLIGAFFAAVLCAVLLKVLRDKLPQDQGREYAVNGEASKGKARGAGIIFIFSFIVSALIFVPLSLEYAGYYVLIFLEMLSGYLDDRSEKPWGEYKKGAIDFVISILASADFVWFNKDLLNIGILNFKLHVHPVVYFILGAVVVWLLINAVNCSDGIDGFSTSLTLISLLSAGAVCYMFARNVKMLALIFMMAAVLMPYLWHNSPPSSIMMGDAGSRALGLFLAIVMFKTGNALLVIPFCFMLCVDGLTGILKVSLIRFLHVNPFKKIRTPIHDHCRKNKGWSDSQVRYRFCIIQGLISFCVIGCKFLLK